MDEKFSMLTLDVEFGPDRPDGGVWVVRVDQGGAWGDAGGVAGDLACTIDGVPAAQALAELASGTRPRLAVLPSPSRSNGSAKGERSIRVGARSLTRKRRPT
jgi:hypothetical protein